MPAGLNLSGSHAFCKLFYILNIPACYQEIDRGMEKTANLSPVRDASFRTKNMSNPYFINSYAPFLIASSLA